MEGKAVDAELERALRELLDKQAIHELSMPCASAADPSAIRLDRSHLAGAYLGKPVPADSFYDCFSLLERGER